jgi:predicted nuclease with TOPRIM domain
MTAQRRRGLQDLQKSRPEKQLAVGKLPARRFPIQGEIHKLEDELNAFNERIAELEDEGHRSHAMDVLRANALDFARRIDELRCVLVESAPKDDSKDATRKRNLSKT